MKGGASVVSGRRTIGYARFVAPIVGAAANFLRGFIGVGGACAVSDGHRSARCGHPDHRAEAASATPAQVRAGLEVRAGRRRSCC